MNDNLDISMIIKTNYVKIWHKIQNCECIVVFFFCSIYINWKIFKKKMSEETAEINPVNPEAVPKPVEPESEVDLANKRNENEKCKHVLKDV